MNAVLISIQPKWVEKICKGKKTIEVRKTKPKIETPFKCYIYCTKGNLPNDLTEIIIDESQNENYKSYFGNGKVIGEFICDKILKAVNCFTTNDLMNEIPLTFAGYPTCMTIKECIKYIGVCKTAYGWHISELKIYDEPKNLSEFRPPILCNNRDKIPTEEHFDIDLMINLPTPQYNKSFFCQKCKYYNGNFQTCDRGYDLKPITRPPQSWCYVDMVI